MACDVRARRKVDNGPLSESMYTACSTHLTTGLACTLTITREYMEHGGRLPANCNLTVYYLPVYPPYSDYNYGLCRLRQVLMIRIWLDFYEDDMSPWVLSSIHIQRYGHMAGFLDDKSTL
jgi:hypothetical protein